MYVLDTARVFPPETPCREVVGVVIPADYGKALREVRLPMKEWEVQVRRGWGEATSCLGLQLRCVCVCVFVCVCVCVCVAVCRRRRSTVAALATKRWSFARSFQA